MFSKKGLRRFSLGIGIVLGLGACGKQEESRQAWRAEHPLARSSLATAGAVGIGIEVEERGGQFIITKVSPGSGAALSRVHEGSVLLSVAGYSTHRLSLAEVRQHLLGKPRTFVNIIVKLPASRSGITVEIAVPRI